MSRFLVSRFLVSRLFREVYIASSFPPEGTTVFKVPGICSAPTASTPLALTSEFSPGICAPASSHHVPTQDRDTRKCSILLPER